VLETKVGELARRVNGRVGGPDVARETPLLPVFVAVGGAH
jgi:hypothetical protein